MLNLEVNESSISLNCSWFRCDSISGSLLEVQGLGNRKISVPASRRSAGAQKSLSFGTFPCGGGWFL